MLKQTDRHFSPIIQDFGCFLMCILYIIEVYFLKREMTQIEIQDIYTQGISSGFIDPEEWYDDRTVDGCYIRKRLEMAQLVLDYFKLPFIVTKFSEESEAQPDCFNILYLVRNETIHHFVVGTDMGHIEWDPWGGGSRCAKEGSVESYRCLCIKEAA